MKNVTELVSIPAIMQLPWLVAVPGIIIVVLLVLSGLRALLRLRLVGAISRLVMSFAVLVILSQGGTAMARLGLNLEKPGEPDAAGRPISRDSGG
jgi:hypothetical protein